MKLEFKYDIEKDVENFLKSFSSINNSQPTKLQQLYLDTFGEADAVKVRQFLLREGSDTPNKLYSIALEWGRVETTIIQRIEELFQTSYPHPITIYGSTNSRCVYNLEGGYFFVYVDGKNTNSPITHELLHFYTRTVFYDALTQKGVTNQKYNDIKEALTELLNTDFVDLLGEQNDRGYPQHEAVRSRIREFRKDGKNVRKIVRLLI